MKVAILDDEISVTSLLKDYLTKYSKESNVNFDITVFNNPEELIKSELAYDLVLLDVQMPKMDGFAVAKKIRELRGEQIIIMFVTNMAQYAIKGYEVEAVDYILKPISYYDFLLKIKKALRFINKKADDVMVIQSPTSKVVLNLSDILYIEVKKHYLIFHTLSGEYTMRGSMREMKEKLAKNNFSSCSNSFLINLQHVKKVKEMEVHIGNEILYMSRQGKKVFLNDLSLYWGGI